MKLSIDQKIVCEIREFFTQKLTLFQAQRKLCAVRNTRIAHYDLAKSREIWMALMIYKFKKEMDATEAVYEAARLVVLGMLRRDDDLKQNIDTYLVEFKKFKESDYVGFVGEVASFYYNLLQIKASIEKTEHRVTMSEWAPHYDELINKIRTKCDKLGCLHALDEFVKTMELKKYDAVSSVMERVFWDRFREELDGGNNELLYANLEELRNYMTEISDTNELKEELDLDYIRQRVKHDVADNQYWLELYRFILGFLESNDAPAFGERYAMAHLEKTDIAEKPRNELITHILEKAFFYTVDLKSRMGIWRNVLNQSTN